MITIKIVSADKKEMVIKNATVLNGVIVTGANGRYTPYFNRVLLASTGKTDAARKAPAVMSAEKIAEFADVMFHLGENEGGYIASIFTPEKPKASKGYNSIFGAASDFGH